MPKQRASEEARILRWFREEGIEKVQVVYGLVQDVVRSRTPLKPKVQKVKRTVKEMRNAAAGAAGAEPGAPAA